MVQDCDGAWADALGADDDLDGVLDELCGGADCDDASASTYPGAAELCDAVDQDCDGTWTDGGADDDGDGVLDELCGGLDCDDASASTYPGAPRQCDWLDHDCDTIADNDSDEDGYASESCGGADCDDGDPIAFPGAGEVCLDGVDQDCDGSADGLMRSISSMTRVTNNTQSSGGPDLVWTGSEYGVVWMNGVGMATETFFQRIAAGGALVGTAAQLTFYDEYVWESRVVWSGSEFGAAWTHHDAGTSETWLVFRRISATGVPVGIEVMPPTTNASVTEMSLAWTGSEYVMAYEDDAATYDGMYMFRVSAGGAPVGSVIVLSEGSDGTEKPALVWSGSEIGLAYVQNMFMQNVITMARLTPTGSRVASDTAVLAIASTASIWDPEMVWAGSLYGLAFKYWQTTSDVNLVRISATGGLLGTPLNLSASSASDAAPDIAWTGSELVVMWHDFSGDSDLLLQRVAPDGTRIDAILAVGGDSYNDSSSSLAWSGSEIGYAWTWDGYGNQEVFFHRLIHCQ